MEDPRIISALFIFLKMAYYNVLINSYTLHGDYYLPDLEINEEEPTYGKYGIMRKKFLKEHRVPGISIWY